MNTTDSTAKDIELYEAIKRKLSRGKVRDKLVRFQFPIEDAVNAAAVGLNMLRAIYARHPTEFQWRTQSIDRLASSARLRAAVERDGGVEALLRTLDDESRKFQDATRPYWLYR